METVVLMDTSIASLNKGDNIIVECIKKEMEYFTKDKFILNLPTHISPFHSYQVWRNSNRLRMYKDCNTKFVCGSNLLIPNMMTHFPQWNINIFNYKAIKKCILVGVGQGSGDKSNYYTKTLYKKMLNKDMYHSVRDERTKIFLESMGIKAINTGCPTMWMLTPEFCKSIPTKKANNVIFTLTAKSDKDNRDQKLIDILNINYDNIYYWVQGIEDFDYLNKFNNIDKIKIVQPTVEAYREVLVMDDLDYIGTRLHAGIYAMRHKKRAIIIVIDERAREINRCNNLNCIEKNNIDYLEEMINSEILTNIKMPFDKIKKWKEQFL